MSAIDSEIQAESERHARRRTQLRTTQRRERQRHDAAVLRILRSRIKPDALAQIEAEARRQLDAEAAERSRRAREAHQARAAVSSASGSTGLVADTPASSADEAPATWSGSEVKGVEGFPPRNTTGGTRRASAVARAACLRSSSSDHDLLNNPKGA